MILPFNKTKAYSAHVAIVVLISLWPLRAPGQHAYTDITPERPGISVIAPVVSFPVVTDAARVPEVAFALEPLDEDPLLASPALTHSAPDYVVDWQPGVDALAAGVSGSGLDGHAKVGLGGRPRDADRWLPGVGNFTYKQDNGTVLSVGQVGDPLAFWGESLRLGGVQLVKLPTSTARGTLLPGTFGLSTSVGFRTLQEIGSANTGGGLSVGAPVGVGTVRMGMTPDLTLESRVQAGSSATLAGLGGTFALSDWGTFQMSTLQTPDLEVPGLPASLTSRADLGLQVHWDNHQFESTYASSRTGQILSEQRVGIRHNWLLSPQVTLQMGADRELVGGNYNLRMQLSVPIEGLASGWWRF